MTAVRDYLQHLTAKQYSLHSEWAGMNKPKACGQNCPMFDQAWQILHRTSTIGARPKSDLNFVRHGRMTLCNIR